MERRAVQVAVVGLLLGLLLGLVTTQPNKDDWDIYSFHINSTVTSRYATTKITSRVANRMDQSKEIEFHVRIPKNAFISKFRMFIDGQAYDGVVKAKEQAERQYATAVSQGQSAGIVSSVGRTLEEFKTSVTVAAHKKVTFELTYEELLKRRLGKYELQIHARPMQPVTDFKVDVHILEDAGINFVEIKGGLSTKELGNAITKTITDKQAWIYFYPTVDQQKVCDSCSDQGLNGDLVIFYDVKRENPFGDLMTAHGYFVHHFAPSALPRIPKNVVFVIDQSGSMHGQKIHQTRVALIHILNDLAEDDFFGIVSFDSELFHWKRELVQATNKNVEDAKTFAQNIRDRGSTDINRAVLEGARMLNAHPREGSASILILLTDGDPTSGETNPQRIQANVRKAIAGKFPLYCLGFGFDVNFEILEKMSLENNGLARRIYEDSDADLQLKGFYEEVATPLLTDVTMIYIGGSNLTQTNFSQYYNGSEIVVAGLITDNNIESFIPEVVAISRNSKMTFSNPNATSGTSGTASDYHIQRVWVYLTVKQLMEKELQLSGPEQDKVKKEAMELSLKYSFVTPLTSMVVTKPQGEDVLNKPKEGEAPVLTTRGRGSKILHSQPQTYSRHLSFPTYASHPGSRRFHSRGYSGGQWIPGIQMGLPGPIGRAVSADLPVGDGRPGLSGHPGLMGLLPDHSVEYEEESLLAHDVHDYVDSPPIVANYPVYATMLPETTTPTAASPTERFLLRPENVSLPLCFDLPANINVKLLHHTTRELFVNGEISPAQNGGFTKIVIKLQSDLSIEVDTEVLTVTEGHASKQFTGEAHITAGSATVVRRDKETDVSVGDIRLLIVVHDIQGRKFLWPVLRQLPSDDSAQGILIFKTTVHEEMQQTSTAKLQIKGQDVYVNRSSAVDYSVPVPQGVHCWLLSAESAWQKPQSDFIN